MKFALAAVATVLATIVGVAQSLPSDWQQFRRQYPYHIQEIALSDADRQGWRTLVIAEPPPTTTLQSLSKLDALLTNGTVKAHPLGTDGWVKDVLYRIPPLPSDKLTGLVDRLSLELFGTTYKAHAFPISDHPRAQPTLDLQISATQLQEWMANAKETFHGLGRSNQVTLQQLLSTATPGVFYSTTPGLVAWIVPRQGNLAANKGYIRQFALDSDFIVGAVAATTQVAILARERQLPLEILPPLRTETILQLAAVGEDELAQSYDRNDYGAGKLEDNRDWAPIYLSDALIDTEYGSLLNITDQLLKSWTNVGRTTYEGFSYPEPTVWPFKMPLGDILQSQSLTYNWNTKGAGYSLATARGQVFALSRTGALPVSYMPQGIPPELASQTAQYEDTAYSFFASDTADPNLARVVQYAALYQVFRHFRDHSAAAAPTVVDHPEMTALTAFVQRALQAFADSDDTDMRSIAAAHGFSRLSVAAVERLRVARDALRNYRQKALDPDLSYLARQTANPRAEENAPTTTALDLMREPHVMAVRRVVDPLRPVIVSSDDALDVYRHASERNAGGWIRTASHVISTSRRPEQVMGGHNLDARLTVFETSEMVPRGSVAIRSNARGERVLTVNPLDAPQVGRVVRTAAREEAGQLKASVEGMLRTPAPKALPRNAALGLPPTLGPAPVEANRGFVATQQLSPGAHRGGWALSGTPPAAEYKAAADPYRVFVDRNADYTFSVTLPSSEGVYSAASYDAAVDLVAQQLPRRTAGAKPLTVFLSGVDPADAANFVKTLEVRTNVAKRNDSIAGFGRSELGSFGQLRDSLARSYNFKAAKVTESAVEPVATGGQRLRVTLEVPAIEAVKPPLLLRIKIFFKERVTDPVRRSVEQVVSRVLGRSPVVRAAGPMTGAEIATAIRADLRQLHPDLDVSVGIDLGIGDFYVADALPEVTSRAVS